MHKSKKIFLKDFIQKSDSPVFGKKTIVGLLRSILEPIAENNAKSFILTRLINKEGIEGLIRRIEYSPNTQMYSFFDVARKNNLIELEFVLITSQRYSALLIWDYSSSENKDSSQVYFKVNSSQINDVFEILKQNLREDFSEAFYAYRPERRENTFMNQAVFNALKLLNENILENDFNEEQSAEYVSRKEFDAYRNSVNKYTREVSHEIKNQLSILDVYLKVLEKKGVSSENMEVLRKSLCIISSQLEELKEFQNISLEKKSLFETISKTVEMLTPLLAQRGNKVVFKGSEMSANIDENKYISALINIVKNASEAVENDVIEIELLRNDIFAQVYITNYGKKIDEPEKIFSSGFSTKGTSGVGLNVSRRYFEAQFSALELKRSDDESTCFVITTPLAEIG